MSYIHTGGSIPSTGIMKKRILSFVSALFLILMGIVKYPVFSYASSQYRLFPYAGFDRNESDWNVVVNSASSSAGTVYCFVCYNTVCRVIVGNFDSAPSFVTTYTSTNRTSGEKIETTNTNVMTSNYNNKCWYSTFSANIVSCNYPIYQASVQTVLESIFGSDNSLGYLKNVGYHVDAYGLENNPVGTNELITWDQESTTGVDLTSDIYQVEFALRDTSTHVDKNMYESFMQDAPALGVSIPGTPLSVDLWEVADAVITGGKYLASYFYPFYNGAQRAYTKGKAVKGSLYGKTTSLGNFPASGRKAAINGISAYKNYFADMTDSSIMKNYIDSIGAAETRQDFYRKAFDYFKSSGADTNLSYDIMARIVDTSNGNKGDWLVIEKHNTPYINSDQQNRLSGGVTVQPSIINNFNPQSNTFIDTPDIEVNPDIDFRPIIRVGYVETGPNVTINEGDIVTINNNYEYTYEGDSIVNDIDNITNIYGDLDIDGDGDDDGDMSDPDNPLGGIKQGLVIAKKFIKSLTSWFRKIFNPFLPIWAQNVVIIAIPITLFGIIWKMVKPLLSLLGKEILPLLIEFFSGIPRLPG